MSWCIILFPIEMVCFSIPLVFGPTQMFLGNNSYYTMGRGWISQTIPALLRLMTDQDHDGSHIKAPQMSPETSSSHFLLIFGHHRIDMNRQNLLWMFFNFFSCTSHFSRNSWWFHGNFMVPAGWSQLGPMFPGYFGDTLLLKNHHRDDGFLGWVIRWYVCLIYRYSLVYW